MADSEGLMGGTVRVFKPIKYMIIAMVVMLVVVLVIAFITLAGVADIHKDHKDAHPHAQQSATGKPKNLIFMVSDGMGPATTRVLADYLETQNKKIALNDNLIGMMETKSDNSLVTDSAAAATAFAAGVRTFNSGLGVDKQGNPVGSIMEAAKAAGVAVGAVVTSRVTHATPAAYTGHAIHRDYEEEIAVQQANMAVDVLFGGGMKRFTKDKRSDDWDINEKAAELGIKKVISTRADLEKLTPADAPVFGLFSSSHLAFEVDRDTSATGQPSLLEMTNKALEILAKKGDDSGNGFFLLVEGSRIDHGQHRNDVAATVFDAEMYDQVFARVKAFSKERNDDTLVISISDHETGGMSVGRAINVARGKSKLGVLGGAEPVTGHQGQDKGSYELGTITFPVDKVTEGVSPYEYNPHLIANLKKSCQKIAEETMAFTATAQKTRAQFMIESFEANTALTLTDAEKTYLTNALAAYEPIAANVETASDSYYKSQMLGWPMDAIISERLYIGWTTKEHTGVDIPVYGYGKSVDQFRGYVTNVEIPQRLASLFGWDVSAVTNKLRDQYKAGNLKIWNKTKGLAPKEWENGRPLPAGNLQSDTA
eukprot:GFYU01008699.1.p1 GENE.GFYU01008699.1~~GFYU01008699.1.p1  ORF type:complete len:596 (+),score=241.75 GFYU01008699.1:97-1884(+)